ncbi:hypothetical protein ACNTMW_18070 [Planosporangium sp. 12N6]|uniref:hypothetical protein n=1 Tax=Planosporangium spinosum TaxID=3402278 RepID=UPI003CED1B0A
MRDRYRISQALDTTDAGSSRGGLLRPALWLGLIVSAAGNAAASSADIGPYPGIAFGLVTLACAAALVVHHYRHR